MVDGGQIPIQGTDRDAHPTLVVRQLITDLRSAGQPACLFIDYADVILGASEGPLALDLGRLLEELQAICSDDLGWRRLGLQLVLVDRSGFLNRRLASQPGLRTLQLDPPDPLEAAIWFERASTAAQTRPVHLEDGLVPGDAGRLSGGLLLRNLDEVRGTSSVFLSMTQVVGSWGVGGLISMAAWVPPTWIVVGMLLASGVVNVCGMLCLNRALKLAPASVVAPFQYTMILWAILLGYVAFGDVPSMQTLAGAAIVTAAGLYIFLRERALLHREPETSPTPAA